MEERNRLRGWIAKRLWGVVHVSPSLLLLSDADWRSVRMWGGCRTERGGEGGRAGGPQDRTRIWMDKHKHV